MRPNMDENDYCSILGNDPSTKLLRRAHVLVLDEIAMMNRVDLERIERSLRMMMNSKKPFGGKIVILSGDFKQILPVENNPAAAIASCIKNSPLYKNGIIKSKNDRIF